MVSEKPGFENYTLFEDDWTGGVLLAGRLMMITLAERRLKMMIVSWKTAEYHDDQLEDVWTLQVYSENDWAWTWRTLTKDFYLVDGEKIMKFAAGWTW